MSAASASASASALTSEIEEEEEKALLAWGDDDHREEGDYDITEEEERRLLAQDEDEDEQHPAASDEDSDKVAAKPNYGRKKMRRPRFLTRKKPSLLPRRRRPRATSLSPVVPIHALPAAPPPPRSSRLAKLAEQTGMPQQRLLQTGDITPAPEQSSGSASDVKKEDEAQIYSYSDDEVQFLEEKPLDESQYERVALDSRSGDDPGTDIEVVSLIDDDDCVEVLVQEPKTEKAGDVRQKPLTESTGVLLGKRFRNQTEERIEEITSSEPTIPPHVMKGSITSKRFASALLRSRADPEFWTRPRRKRMRLERELHIRSVPVDWDEDVLASKMSAYGEIARFNFFEDSRTALITFETVQSAKLALEGFTDRQFNGTNLVMNLQVDTL